VTLVSVDLASAATVIANAALKPLKEVTHTLFNTATRYGIRKLIKIDALEELGVTTGPDAGEALPPWVVLPEAAPPRAPRAGRARSTSIPPRRTPSARRASASPPPPAVGASGGVLGELYAVPTEVAAAAVVDAGVQHTAVAAAVGAATAATRADINRRVGEACETMFDKLPTTAKVRLRGRTDDMFHFLAHGSLQRVERLVDASVQTTVSDAVLNEPRSYPGRLDAVDARPAAVQVLIRTAQRLLNAEVVHQFAKTRSEHASDELAEGVSTRKFLETVAHHARRDLWSPEAIEWADERADAVVQRVRGELQRFLELIGAL
jgi:hypothetical protein